MQYEEVVNKISQCDRLARRICTGYSHLLESNHFFQVMEERQVKHASKRKRLAKSVPVLGAAGLTFSLVGGASAAVAPTTDAAKSPVAGLGHGFTLGEEEIADVSLATFYVFDKENAAAAKNGVQEARGCGGRGCGGRGCGGRGCRGCRGCGGWGGWGWGWLSRGGWR